MDLFRLLHQRKTGFSKKVKGKTADALVVATNEELTKRFAVLAVDNEEFKAKIIILKKE